MRGFILLLLVTIALAACGQKGDLYLKTDKAPKKAAATTSKPQGNSSTNETKQADQADTS